MVPALQKAVESVRSGAQGQLMYTEYDCQLLPQTAYFKNAEWVIDLQSFDSVGFECIIFWLIDSDPYMCYW